MKRVLWWYQVSLYNAANTQLPHFLSSVKLPTDLLPEAPSVSPIFKISLF